VQRIWQPLLAAAKRRGDISTEQEQLAWEIMIGKDRSINAFALPGGYFGLHLGLVGAVSTRDELASVLAHELVHVSQRHIARQIDKQNQQSPWLLGAMILGAIAASKNPQTGSAVLAGSQAVSAQSQLNFSRDMEREADRIGFAVLQEAGMDVRGFTGMFDKLQTANRINDSGSFPYLRTHPLTTERLGDMQARLHLLPALANEAPLGLQAEHALMATRARLLSDSSVGSLRNELTQAAQALRNPLAPNATTAQKIRQLAQLYGGALASSRQREAAQSLRYAQAARELLTSIPFEQVNQSVALIEPARSAIELIVIEAALIAPSAEAISAAIRSLSQLRSTPSLSNDRPTLLAWAQLAVNSVGINTPGLSRQEAVDALQTHLAQHSQDAAAWQALASLYEVQGQTLRSLRAAAESRVAQLDYGAALDRLKAAQEWARVNNASHIDASIIDTRTRAVQSLVKELKNERDK
jgi:predicted Zn-dependent protease